MSENAPWNEKRTTPRISWNFIVKFRSEKLESLSELQVSTIQNISEGGCSFFSATQYHLEERLHLEIQFPAIREPMKFLGIVKRCEHVEGKKISPYFIGIQFTEMDETKKSSFIQTLSFFLNKQSR